MTYFATRAVSQEIFLPKAIWMMMMMMISLPAHFSDSCKGNLKEKELVGARNKHQGTFFSGSVWCSICTLHTLACCFYKLQHGQTLAGSNTGLFAHPSCGQAARAAKGEPGVLVCAKSHYFIPLHPSQQGDFSFCRQRNLLSGGDDSRPPIFTYFHWVCINQRAWSHQPLRSSHI